ncbi:MAG: hypothetical protein QNJ15_05480 [Erythrobacter sp.]|nr:hypothetical protein [Erythrobacter sp.]
MSPDPIVLLMLFVGGLAPVYIISTILRFFVGLKMRPSERAAALIFPAYLATVLAFGFLFQSDEVTVLFNTLLSVLIPAPAAILLFFFYRWQFINAWVEDPDELRYGQSLENDSWVRGLLYLAGAGAIGVLIGYLRDVLG